MTLFGILLGAATIFLGIVLLWVGIQMGSITGPFVILVALVVLFVGLGMWELT